MPRAPATPAVRTVIDRGQVPSTEELLTSPEYYGLTTATPVQRAICRAADGQPLGDLWKDKLVRKAFGGKRPPAKQPATIVIIAGTRGAKSMFAASRAVRSALTCDLEGLVAGDRVRIPCLATGKETAGFIHSHALALMKTPRLAPLLVGKPLTASFEIGREDGFDIEVSTVALSSQGNNVVGSWLGGIVFDEAPRMGSETSTVRSLRASRQAAADRVLPGGQEMLVGSPYAPNGDVYELWRTRFGHPDEDVVVIQASGPMLNPKHWTPELLEKLRVTDPFTYVTSGLGEFADPADSIIPSKSIENMMGDAEERKPQRDAAGELKIEYVAALGAAERGNSWILTIVGTTGKTPKGLATYEQAVSFQWVPEVGKPLDTTVVLLEAKEICARYGLDQAFINQRFVMSYLETANAIDFGLLGIDLESDERIEMCDKLRDAIVEGRLHLTANRQQYADLQHVRKVPTVNGIVIQYPSSGDSMACDFVQPLGLCIVYAPDPPTGSLSAVPKVLTNDQRNVRALDHLTRGG